MPNFGLGQWPNFSSLAILNLALRYDWSMGSRDIDDVVTLTTNGNFKFGAGF